MRAAAVAGFLFLSLPALAQTSAPSISPPSPSPSPSTQPPTPIVPAPAPLAPNVSPTQAAPVQSPTSPPVTPDPSPSQAAPLPSPVPTPGTTTRPRQAPAAAGTRVNRDQATPSNEEMERERQRREERLRANDQRLRRLIQDICIGCGGPAPTGTRRSVVRAKG